MNSADIKYGETGGIWTKEIVTALWARGLTKLGSRLPHKCLILDIKTDRRVACMTANECAAWLGVS